MPLAPLAPKYGIEKISLAQFMIVISHYPESDRTEEQSFLAQFRYSDRGNAKAALAQARETYAMFKGTLNNPELTKAEKGDMLEQLRSDFNERYYNILAASLGAKVGRPHEIAAQEKQMQRGFQNSRSEPRVTWADTNPTNRGTPLVSTSGSDTPQSSASASARTATPARRPAHSTARMAASPTISATSTAKKPSSLGIGPNHSALKADAPSSPAAAPQQTALVFAGTGKSTKTVKQKTSHLRIDTSAATLGG